MARVVNQVRTLRFLAGEMTQAELGEKIGLVPHRPGVRQAARGSVQLGGMSPHGASVARAPAQSSVRA